jgi:hypothetical protein
MSMKELKALLNSPDPEIGRLAQQELNFRQKFAADTAVTVSVATHRDDHVSCTDERWLLRLYRALPTDVEREEVLQRIGCALMERYLPGTTIYDLMPIAVGFEPRGSIHDESSAAHIIYCGAEEMVDPRYILLGVSCRDEEAVSRFARGARNAAMKQGRYFNFDEAFAREYLLSWREEIVEAIERQSRKARKE